MQSLHSSAKCWVRIVAIVELKLLLTALAKNYLRFHKWQPLRNVQITYSGDCCIAVVSGFWLLVQGDFPYMMSRAFARVRPNAFDQR